MNIKKESHDRYRPEEVDRVTHSKVKTVRDECLGLWPHRERTAMFNPGQKQKQQRRQSDDCAVNPHRSPRLMGVANSKQNRAHHNDQGREDVRFHRLRISLKSNHHAM